MKKVILVFVLLLSSLYAREYTLKAVHLKDFQKNIRLGGTLKSINEGYISTRFSGYIESLHVDVGDKVKQGELLVSIDAIEKESLVLSSKANLSRAKASLQQAEANYQKAKNQEKSALFQAKDAKANFERYESLYKNGAVSKRDYEQVELDMDVKERLAKAAKQAVLQAKSGVDEANAAIKSLEINVVQSSNSTKYFELRAKYEGIVTAKLKKEYELVSPGERILHLASLSPLELVLNVPASVFQTLKIDQEVELHSTLFKNPKSAKVKTLVPYAKAGTHSYEVRLQTDDKSLLPGLYVEANLFIPFKSLTAIEPSMLAFRGGLKGEFVEKEGKAVFKVVHVKIKEADMLGVEGLSDGEKVVIYPPLNLHDGTELK